MLGEALHATMALLSSLELLFVVLIVGLLFLLSIRAERGSRLNVLPFLIIGLLLLGIFSLGRLLLAYFAITVLLTLTVIVLLAITILRLMRR